MFSLLLVLFVVFVVIPFICGFFDRGYEWVMYPSKYLTMYLFSVVKIGDKVKSFFSK